MQRRVGDQKHLKKTLRVYVRQAFHRYLLKSIRSAARQLELTRSTVHKVMQKI